MTDWAAVPAVVDHNLRRIVRLGIDEDVIRRESDLAAFVPADRHRGIRHTNRCILPGLVPRRDAGIRKVGNWLIFVSDGHLIISFVIVSFGVTCT